MKEKTIEKLDKIDRAVAKGLTVLSKGAGFVSSWSLRLAKKLEDKLDE